jgi:hypothetical protein
MREIAVEMRRIARLVDTPKKRAGAKHGFLSVACVAYNFLVTQEPGQLPRTRTENKGKGDSIEIRCEH